MRIYIYLAARNKRGIKLLTTLPGDYYPATKIENIKELNLPIDLESKISQIAYVNRMKHELWIQSAKDYEDLKQNLRSKGYTKVPANSSVVFEMEIDRLAKKNEPSRFNFALESKLKSTKSMLRKRKD